MTEPWAKVGCPYRLPLLLKRFQGSRCVSQLILEVIPAGVQQVDDGNIPQTIEAFLEHSP